MSAGASPLAGRGRPGSARWMWTRPPATRPRRFVPRMCITSSRLFPGPSRPLSARCIRRSDPSVSWVVSPPSRSSPRRGRQLLRPQGHPRRSQAHRGPPHPEALRELWEERAQRLARPAEMRVRRLAARWLIPVEGAPIERAALLIGSEGRIEAVGPDASVPRPADAAAEDFGEAVILPGLINTHTHLELTGFASQIHARNFPVWIKQLRELKATRTSAEYVAAARRGLEACYASGVTTIADTGDSGAAIRALAEAKGSGVAYQEVFGPHPSQARASLAALRDRVIESGRWAVQRVRIGVSPHSPYTVSGPLLEAVVRWASSQGLPLAVHIAESRAETELLMSGAGQFAAAWHERGIPLPEPLGRTPVEWLDDHAALTERTLCIHAV